MLEAETYDRVVWIRAHFSAQETVGLGTGFQLDATRVLTARHVIVSGDGKTLADRIQVIPRGVSPEGEDSDRFDAELEWEGLDDEGKPLLDAALLSVREARELGPFDRLIEALSDFDTWKLVGFVANTLDFRDKREPSSMHGTFQIANLDRAEIPLQFDGNPPDPATGAGSWAGASGGPVFVREGDKEGWLCGILGETAGDYGDRLLAVSMAAILSAPRFRRALGPESSTKAPESSRWDLIWRIVNVLREDPSLTEELMALDLEYRKAAGQSLTALVDALLLNADLGELLTSLYKVKVRRNLSGKNLSNLQEVAKALASLLGYQSAEKRGAIQLDRGIWLLDSSNENYAALVEGGKKGLPADFEPQRGDVPRPAHHLRLSSIPTGISPTEWQADQVEQIFIKLVHDDLAKPPLLHKPHMERVKSQLGGLQDDKTAIDLASIIQQALEIRDVDRRRPWRLVLWARDDNERLAPIQAHPPTVARPQ